jgi:hypothetical protein
MSKFNHSLSSEWLKTRRTAASWLVIIGGFFIPLIMTCVQIFRPDRLSPQTDGAEYWNILFLRSWESMAIFLMPMGVILCTSMIAQLEYKNNAWKQVFTLPQSMASIFTSKLVIILFMLAQFFVLFTLGILISAYLPPFLNGTHVFPMGDFPWQMFLKETSSFYLTCLPIVAFQYLISLRYSNFMVSVGVGMALVVGSIFAINWKYGFIFPYSYSPFHFLALTGSNRIPNWVNIYWISAIWFVIVTAVNYILYISKKEKG